MTASACKAVRARLGELVAGEAPAAVRAELGEHVEGCAACARAVAEAEATVGLLRRAGRAEAPVGFTAALHRRLVMAGRPERLGLWARLLAARGWRPALWAAVGAAAAAAAVLALSALRAPAPARAPLAEASRRVEGPVAPTFRVPAARLAVVKIDFVAEQPVAEVEFAVALPEGLAFVSGGQELPDREFRWRGALDKGSNEIPVAVRGARAGQYRIDARVAGGGVEASHQVVLEVTEG